jgi:hypothetical protein
MYGAATIQTKSGGMTVVVVVVVVYPLTFLQQCMRILLVRKN